MCAEINRVEFSDWVDHFEEPPVTRDIWKGFEKHGGDPRRWRQAWLKELGMSSRERTAIEVTVLTDAMHLAGCYDQINGPALASMETLSFRLAQLIEAYASGDPSKPNWSGVKYFQHSTGPLNLVPKILRTHAHRWRWRLRTCGSGPLAEKESASMSSPTGPSRQRPTRTKGLGKGKQRTLAAGGAAAPS